MEDGVYSVEERAHAIPGEVRLDELEGVRLAGAREVALLQLAGIVLGEAVDPHDLVPVREQPVAEVGSEEPGGPCHQRALSHGAPY